MCDRLRINREFSDPELNACFFRTRNLPLPLDQLHPPKMKNSQNMVGKILIFSSGATLAQFNKRFGSGKYPDLFSCACAGKRLIVVIIEKKVDIELDELQENDWTSGSYQDILSEYNANETKENIFPDILSIANQSDPIPMKDVSDDFMDQMGGRYLGESPLARTLSENEIRMEVW